MRKHDGARVGPLLDAALLSLDRIRELTFDRKAVGKIDGRFEHLLERQGAVLGQHGDEAARSSRSDRRKRPVFGRVTHPFRFEELGSRAGRGDAEGVESDDLAGVRIEDESLGLAAPAERVPQGAGRRKHGRGGIDRVPPFLEDHRAGRSRERLAGDGHPALAVKRRLLCPKQLCMRGKDQGKCGREGDEGRLPRCHRKYPPGR